MSFNLTSTIKVAVFTEAKESRAIGPKLRRDTRTIHLEDILEGETGVLVSGGKASESSESGLVGDDGRVSRHAGEDLEATLEAKRVGEGGAEVKEGVVEVKVEGEGGGEGVVVEVESRRKVEGFGAHVEAVAEEALW